MPIFYLTHWNCILILYFVFCFNLYCIFVRQSASVDHQQALIAYSNSDECFILQDLSSSHGTFVNDCCIRNAVVRLAAGDVIRFGYDEPTYMFVTDHSPQVILCLRFGLWSTLRTVKDFYFFIFFYFSFLSIDQISGVLCLHAAVQISLSI